ncbi:AMP binding protein [Coprinopsis cinerea okayama7|uniref:AMP binding protein n=1 Tax=Coprinopsis cinerea (strain Okayama-7 / 130 / ATCC MYA-4618 / FGSC 9003) TaxID=240176 RepID=A8P6U4_COPC7|nr:AMP binding protein [Coprinopsis cinerea okayama7\|eukprot:XP_001839229.1 AMP binding protein [Coprinopsis cinerea okayama7\
MTPATVYRSRAPPVPVVRKSVFTYLFEDQYMNEGALPAKPAYIDASTGQTLTREQVKTYSLKFAWGLRNRLSLRRGDTVMLMSPNSLSWPLALFGCVAAGLKISFAGCSATPRELSWQYLDSKPRVILVASHLVPVVKDMFALIGEESKGERDPRIWVIDDLGDYVSPPPQTSTSKSNLATNANDCVELVRGGKLERAERFDGDAAEETVYICYSSGTTGKPKGVETTHKNVCTVLPMTQALWKGCETSHDVYLAVLPAYHMFGLAMQLHYPLRRGKPVVMMNQGFSSEAFCQAVQTYRITSLLLVPPILLTLSEYPDLEKYDLGSLTNIASGAAPLSLALANKFLDQLKKQGANVILIQGCGSTETTCPCQIVAPENAFSKFGSVGELLPNIEARIMVELSPTATSTATASVDGSLFRDANDGEEGEMWLKGPTITKGYLNNPQANASTFTRDGWFRTGDVLRRDPDGYYYIMDRKKEMLKYKGHQIAPAELESVLMENPEVGDVGVIGIMDVYSGNELPRAYVRPANADILKSPTLKKAFELRLAKWFEGHVSNYKFLRGGVIAIPDVPKSATGKILRKELREWAKAEQRKDREIQGRVDRSEAAKL